MILLFGLFVTVNWAHLRLRHDADCFRKMIDIEIIKRFHNEMKNIIKASPVPGFSDELGKQASVVATGK